MTSWWPFLTIRPDQDNLSLPNLFIGHALHPYSSSVDLPLSRFVWCIASGTCAFWVLRFHNILIERDIAVLHRVVFNLSSAPALYELRLPTSAWWWIVPQQHGHQRAFFIFRTNYASKSIATASHLNRYWISILYLMIDNAKSTACLNMTKASHTPNQNYLEFAEKKDGQERGRHSKIPPFQIYSLHPVRSVMKRWIFCTAKTSSISTFSPRAKIS